MVAIQKFHTRVLCVLRSHKITCYEAPMHNDDTRIITEVSVLDLHNEWKENIV